MLYHHANFVDVMARLDSVTDTITSLRQTCLKNQILMDKIIDALNIKVDEDD